MNQPSQQGVRADAADVVLNVPNQLTFLRLLLSLVLFVLLAFRWYSASLLVFIVAAATDWIDGYWARKYGQITVLGRILDPLADKMIVCGTYVFLAAETQSRVPAWMAVVILGRELLVTALRSHAEGQSVDFSARLAGKWKMVVQCLTAGLAMYRLTYLDTSTNVGGTWATVPPAWLDGLLDALLWTAVLITVYSGAGYVRAAVRLLRTPDGSAP